MEMKEYEKVKGMRYDEYCEYLKGKYGHAKVNYFTPKWNKNQKVTRTNEGLLCHHQDEDKAIMLSDKEFAKRNPMEYQKAERLVYCDYLEHLLLHVMIFEEISFNHNEGEIPGLGGVINFLVPELNDVYSGFRSKLAWKEKCYSKVKDDEDVYLEIVERFVHSESVKGMCSMSKAMPLLLADRMCESFNERYGIWRDGKDLAIYNRIIGMFAPENRFTLDDVRREALIHEDDNPFR